ncbi:receptor-like protein kinase FERONIA [Vigna radiata var. radiata]|uniref:Receptor-like protein kinase FERONIA n=1 Tax=Vigna radiata var. radiata TaxID=3916 RepID=A0A1S3V3N8_VIGRR|nr:receptor-like protein kinase FERONIA [Vigna radiata var. radiata]
MTIFTFTFLKLFFLLLLHFSTRLQAYISEEVFTINCGTTGNSSDGQRTWTGDTDTKYLSSQDTTVSDKASTQSPSTNQVPFSTARLSRSQFNYSFPVSPGTKFLRLFFYPADYPSFPRNHASFSVQSNHFILLNDFNASLNADAQATDTIFREYVVNVNDGERLILTFIPSHPNSYAFINGIEVLSMPTDLYYTPANDTGFTTVGTSTLYSVGTSFALQTEYRIKAGGQEISPYNDSGLFRDWAAEEPYFIKRNPKNDDLPADVDGKMDITVNPDYLAPKELFRTARNMGTNATLNKMSNLTWEFPVDYGFTYVLRLHFCELDPNINKIGDRKFHIYITSQVADDRADVMKWSNQQKGLAVHRNYAVFIPENGAQKKFNLSLQMHPYESGVDTKYSDAFLNGLEIFKISEAGSNNLAGPNPDPVQTPQTNIPGQNGKTRSGSSTTIIGAIAGVVSGIVLISLIVFLVVFFRRKRTTKPKDYNKSKSSATSKWGPLSFTTTKSTTTNSSLPSDLCRHFSLTEIRAATNNFDDVFIVGAGGFGHVYKGYIDGGSTPVAIKRLKPGSQQGAHEFMNEIEMLSQLRHLHLVSLIGYCNEMNEMILIYDFMARGTLRDHLYNTDNPAIPWKERLKICIGAARGLHYLHTGAKHTIIHRDVKTTNILLDDKWVAKVSDFGLSRIGPTGMSKAHVSTVVKGSIGYLDPEYYKRQQLTEKSDVYSFGVVLFELLCARPPLIRTAEKKQVSLADWARHCYQNGTIAQIVDPTLKGRIAPECLRKFCEIGVSCLLDDGTQRPSMNDVVWMLEFALQLQESAEQRDNANVIGGEGDNERREEGMEDLFSSGTSVGQVSDFNKSSGSVVSVSTSSEELSSSYKESDRLVSGTVFSEIVDPKPR